MADLAKVQRNVGRMIDGGAPESEINQYLASERVSPGALRSYGKASRQQGSTFEALTDRMSSWVPFADEAAGAGSAVGSVIRNAVVAPFSDKVDFDPVKAGSEGYIRGKRDFEKSAESAKAKAPNLRYVADAAGIAGSMGRPGKALAKEGATLFGRVVQGAKAGATGGAVQGLSEGEDGQRLVNAGIGATAGTVLGAGLPVAGAAIAAPFRTIKAAVRPDEGLARNLVAEAMAADNLAPSVAGGVMDDAAARGVPLTLGDLGDNLRGLAGSVSRQPGPARTMMRDAVINRQMGQGERVRGAISRDLGPIADPMQVSDDLIAQAQARSTPLYEQAYSTPAVSSPELEAILQTPAGKGAVQRAFTIAANERRDPGKMGFILGEDGNVVLNPTAALGADEAGNLTATLSPQQAKSFSPQTLDYVKRGLDDLLEPYRNPITGKMQLDEAGRAIDGVRKQLIKEVDRVNPAYGQARAAYAGPARERDALNLGRSALRLSPEEITRATSRLSESEREQFALGFRAALSDTIDNKVDNADKVGALLGTPKKRAALARVFGGNANFEQFVRTMTDERAANETYRAVATGSPTANRLADDAATGDQALLDQATGRFLQAARGGVSNLAAELLSFSKELRRFGAGKAGAKVREDLAALLSESDPAILRDAMKRGARARAAGRVAQRRAGAVSGNLSVNAGRGAGLLTQGLGQPSK